MTRSFSARLGLIVRQPIMIDRMVQGAWPCVILGAVYRLSTPEANRSYTRGPGRAEEFDVGASPFRHYTNFHLRVASFSRCTCAQYVKAQRRAIRTTQD